MQHGNETKHKSVPERTQQTIRWQLVIAGIVGMLLFFQYSNTRSNLQNTERGTQQLDALQISAVLPKEGVELPARWGNTGLQMVEAGVIDNKAFEALYAGRGGLSEDELRLLYGTNNERLVITQQNAGLLLNLLWAFGLSNKNPILEEGPMRDPQYGGIEYFASTGGWTLAKGNIKDHYGAHEFVVLTPQQQALVESVSKNIYRPCCNNPTYFPDCNHGMAMLGLLELMAAEGASENEMYAAALAVNSYWFPDTYLTIAQYFKERGISWENVNPKEVLGPAYSSASGFNRILATVNPPPSSGGLSCGI